MYSRAGFNSLVVSYFTLKTRHFKEMVGSCLIRLSCDTQLSQVFISQFLSYFLCFLHQIGHMFSRPYDHQFLTIFSCLVSNSALYKELSFPVHQIINKIHLSVSTSEHSNARAHGTAFEHWNAQLARFLPTSNSCQLYRMDLAS